MKIAIVTRQLIIGGVEKALLGMIRNMNSEDEVDLYVEQLGGELFSELPEWVRVIEIPRRVKWVSTKETVIRICEMMTRIRLRFCRNYIKQCELSARSFPKISKKYDMAIAYHAPNTIPMFYTVNNLRAEKKVLWLHGDVEVNNMTSKLAKQYYKRYDKIFAVSKHVKEVFVRNFPELSVRCTVFHNIIDFEQINNQANILMDTLMDKGAILTVGRLSEEKGQDMIPKIARILRDKGYCFTWYLIGDGPTCKKINREIEKYGVEKHVILLGNKPNPYPYIKNCDIYVQTSLAEGWGLSVQEAKILEKPIIVTPISAFVEQIKDGRNGMVAAEATPEAISDSIIRVIEHPELKNKFIQELKNDKNSNYTSLQELYNICK